MDREHAALWKIDRQASTLCQHFRDERRGPGTQSEGVFNITLLQRRTHIDFCTGMGIGGVALMGVGYPISMVNGRRWWLVSLLPCKCSKVTSYVCSPGPSCPHLAASHWTEELCLSGRSRSTWQSGSGLRSPCHFDQGHGITGSVAYSHAMHRLRTRISRTSSEALADCSWRTNLDVEPETLVIWLVHVADICLATTHHVARVVTSMLTARRRRRGWHDRLGLSEVGSDRKERQRAW